MDDIKKRVCITELKELSDTKVQQKLTLTCFGKLAGLTMGIS
jgi:hypothetical protein